MPPVKQPSNSGAHETELLQEWNSHCSELRLWITGTHVFSGPVLASPSALQGWDPDGPSGPAPSLKFISDVQHLPRSDHSVGPHSDASVSEDVGLTFQGSKFLEGPVICFKIEWSWIIGHDRFMKRHDGFDLQRQIKHQTQNTNF